MYRVQYLAAMCLLAISSHAFSDIGPKELKISVLITSADDEYYQLLVLVANMGDEIIDVVWDDIEVPGLSLWTLVRGEITYPSAGLPSMSTSVKDIETCTIVALKGKQVVGVAGTLPRKLYDFVLGSKDAMPDPGLCFLTLRIKEGAGSMRSVELIGETFWLRASGAEKGSGVFDTVPRK